MWEKAYNQAVVTKKGKKAKCTSPMLVLCQGCGPVTIIFHVENDTGRHETVAVRDVTEGTPGFLKQQHRRENTASRVNWGEHIRKSAADMAGIFSTFPISGVKLLVVSCGPEVWRDTDYRRHFTITTHVFVYLLSVIANRSPDSL